MSEKHIEKLKNVPKLRFPEFRDSGEWEEKKLHQIASPVSEKAQGKDKETALTLSAEYGIVSQGDYFGKRIAGENVDRYIKISLNDFVYNDRITKLFTYGTIKRLSQYQSGLVSPIYKCFRFKESENPVFWEWYFESGNHEIPLQKLVNEGARAGRFNISIQKFLSITVWSPESSEQQKIADCLASLDDRLAAETQTIDTLKAHKKGLMQQLFPAKGETLPKLRFPEFRDAGEWEEKRIEDLSIRGSGHTPNKREPSYYNGGIKWVSLADSNKLDNRYIYDTKIKISKEGLENSSAVLHPPGTVIISRDAGVGKSAVLYSAMAVSQHFIVWRCDESKLSNWFLYYFLQVLKPQFEAIATGSTIKTIGLPYFKELCIFTPSIPEQQTIANCLTSLDETIAAQAETIELLKLHKKGLMQQLFPSVEEVRG